MKSIADIFWCTGMSGTGKSTLSLYAKGELKRKGLSVLILDGDVIRDKYKTRLGFGREDVEKNNLNVAKLCEGERDNYDVIIVPIISSIDTVRRTVRKNLSPGFHLMYITADIESLKDRDPKGLYKKADNGELIGLIGYSDSNPYDIPQDYDLIVDTSKQVDVERSKELFLNFILQNIIEST